MGRLGAPVCADRERVRGPSGLVDMRAGRGQSVVPQVSSTCEFAVASADRAACPGRFRVGSDLAPHSHPPRVVIAVSPYRIKSVDLDGRETIIDRRPGEASWVEDERHTATVRVGPTHVIEVEVKWNSLLSWRAQSHV
jgi:hypothetical protein